MASKRKPSPKARPASPATLAALHAAANPDNPRKPWDKEQEEAFMASLLEFGDLSGIIFNRTTGRTVGGHKRVAQFTQDKKAKLSQLEKVSPADATGTVAWGNVILENGTRFAYREVEWPEKKELAANLAANKWGADWDWQKVSDMLHSIGDGFDLKLTGFRPEELEPLIAADWTPPAQDEDLPGANSSSTTYEKDKAHHVGLTDAAWKALTKYKGDCKLPDYSAAVLALLKIAKGKK